MDVNLTTLALIVVAAGLMAYQLPFLHNWKVAYFSLLQILYLVVMPGFVTVMAFTEMQRILGRPLIESPMLPDRLLANAVILALMFTYGGLAIHAVTKMLSTQEKLRFDTSEVGQMNKFFHLQFSHNLIYGGAAILMLSFSMLELNHLPAGNTYGFWSSVIKGVVLGTSLVIALFIHTRSKDEYAGKWGDFKGLFMMMWAGLVLLLYGVKKLRPDIMEYELLVPAMVSWAILSVLGVVLVVRRVKNGGYVVKWKWKRLVGGNE